MVFPKDLIHMKRNLLQCSPRRNVRKELWAGVRFVQWHVFLTTTTKYRFSQLWSRWLSKAQSGQQKARIVEHQLALGIRFRTRTSVAQNLILALTSKLTIGSLPRGEDRPLQLLIHSTSSRRDPFPGLWHCRSAVSWILKSNVFWVQRLIGLYYNLSRFLNGCWINIWTVEEQNERGKFLESSSPKRTPLLVTLNISILVFLPHIGKNVNGILLSTIL